MSKGRSHSGMYSKVENGQGHCLNILSFSVSICEMGCSVLPTGTLGEHYCQGTLSSLPTLHLLEQSLTHSRCPFPLPDYILMSLFICLANSY